MISRTQKELLAIAIAAAVMTLKIVVMVTLLRQWKTQGEPDV